MICNRCLEIELVLDEAFDIELVEDQTLDVELEVGTQGISSKYPEYLGPYEATPKTEDQVFATNKTSMENDFTVFKIPYQEVSNPQGGETVIIAFE